MKTRYSKLSAKHLSCGILGGLVGFAVGFGLPLAAGLWLNKADVLAPDNLETANEAIAWLVLSGTAVGAFVGAQCGLSLSGYKS